MRLLNTITRELREVHRPPRYCILSHRWGDNEVSFEEYSFLCDEQLEHMRRSPRATRLVGKEGYQKISSMCKFAQSRGFEWVWIDTCCIDKRSSAELTEAINSMWNWYAGAVECYAYLADVLGYDIAGSKWFSRGWTLQELLAPCQIVFCNQRWEILSTLRKNGRQHLIPQEIVVTTVSQVTRIPAEYLTSTDSFGKASVAQRMSWAADRETTRDEDEAYCLLGLFGINMPLLYGEGHRAFVRLQKEIIQQSDDESIFVWKRPSHDVDRRDCQIECVESGILAVSPKLFKDCGHIIKNTARHRVQNFSFPRLPFSITNKGLDFTCEAQRFCEGRSISQFVFAVPLACSIATQPGGADPIDCVPCIIALACSPSWGPESIWSARFRVYACDHGH